MRKIFNTHILKRINAGELTGRVLKDGHPSPPLANEPFCTRSQMISYCDSQGKRVALVHQYLRKDGTRGLSGKPDPKRLEHNNVIYILDT